MVEVDLLKIILAEDFFLSFIEFVFDFVIKLTD